MKKLRTASRKQNLLVLIKKESVDPFSHVTVLHDVVVLFVLYFLTTF